MKFTEVLDGALDRSVVLGYTKVGSRLRRLWWPADPPANAMAGKRVVVTGATAGWAETPGVAEALPTFQKLTRPLLRDAGDGADTAVWLVATRPISEPPHFWHDRAQRPTTFGWQRSENGGIVARFLDEVSAMTGTTRSWVGLRT